MNLAQLFALINELAKQNGISQPYLVGGVPRCILVGDDQYNDFDITTGSDDIFRLAEIVANTLNCKLRPLRTGGKKLIVGSIELDFSNNFKYKNIDSLMDLSSYENRDLARETFSRDFTINSLLMPLSDMTKVIDLTGHGLQDLREKRLRCPVDFKISFEIDPSRMLRALALKAKYNLDMDDEMFKYISENRARLREIDPRYAGTKINEVVRHMPDMLDRLIELDILKEVPLTKELVKKLIADKKLIKVL